MDQLHQFLERVKGGDLATGHFRGLLYILIAQRVLKEDGTVVSSGMTWRAAAAALKQVRWDRESVRELGIEPTDLAPRDRERFWYLAISRANLGSAEARASAEVVAQVVVRIGYVIAAPESVPGEWPVATPPD